MANVTAVYSPRPGRVYVEFSTESYWHLVPISCLPILPQSLIEQLDQEGWEDWSPSADSDSLVTSGPFTVANVTGLTLTMLTNPLYFRSGMSGNASTISTIVRTVAGDQTGPYEISLSIGGVAGALAIVALVILVDRRRSSS